MSVNGHPKYDFQGQKLPDIIYEDDQCVAYEEQKRPQAMVHFLVVPKQTLPRISNLEIAEEKYLGHLLIVAKNLAIEKGLLKTGYHVMVDEDFKTLKLKSLHVFGRSLQHMLWPVGPGSRL